MSTITQPEAGYDMTGYPDHTPGPWEQWADGFGDYHIGPIAGGTVGAVFSRRAADARLIAAAPELLAALIEILDASNKPANERWLSNVRSHAIAAIAKATA